MIEVAFKYMAHQPWKPVHKDSKGLRATWSKAFEKLRYELNRISAKDVVVEAGYKPSQVRADGWPYSNAKPDHGQIRVNYTRDGIPFSFFFGGWKEPEMNAYMIALTLERLRAVERYGCAQGGEQYSGWAKLPPGGGIQTAEWASIEDAMRFLSKTADGDVVSVLAKDLDMIYRQAARKAHPDAGGSNELMAKVNRARDFVERGSRQ